ncbi:MAG TPA: NAD-dependent epimerase/dehydratase family protein [Ktedonobacterales bacterium]
MRYFVTGATGFIGGEVARRLAARGDEVVALVRDPARARALAALGVTLAAGDVTDRESLRAPMTGVNGVFHIAGWYKIGARDRRPGMAINVDGTRNVLETMRELGVRKGVYTSTVAIFSDTHGQVPDETYRYDGPHLTEYDRTKWLAHYDVAEPLARAGLPLVIVLPGLVYGPGDTSAVHDSLAQYVRGKLPAIPSVTAYCWAHVGDTAQGHLLAMDRGLPGEEYIIAGEVATMVDALAMAQRVTGVRAPTLRLAPGMLRVSSALVRPFEGPLGLQGMYTAEGLRDMAGVTYLGSNAKARRDLGYAPRPLEEGLPSALAWEMEQAGIKSTR